MSLNKFFKMLEHHPRIAHIWDKKTKRLNVELLENELGVMSSGECHMAKFFASIWFNNNERYGFDLADAAAHLDKSDIDVVVEWLKNPFWP